MTQIEYTPYGPHGDEHPARGTVIDILLEINGLILKRRRVPPREVVNLIMSKGVWDQGMGGGCKWTSFTIDENEYSELVQEGVDSGWEVVEYPAWVKTVDHYIIWQYDIDYGVPWEEHKRLSDIAVISKAALTRAIEQNKSEEIKMKLHLENYYKQKQVSDYFMLHINRNR